jgi:SnoaL-like domain
LSTVFADPVDELLARVRIEDTLKRHSRGIDRYDVDLRASTFTPDATIDAGSGPQPAAELLRRRGAEHAHTRHTVHALSNVLIEFVSSRVAFVESHVFACESEGSGYDFSWRGIAAGPAGARLLSWGRYLDVFECRDGNWLISERSVVYGDTTSEPLLTEPELPTRFLQQVHGPGDPIDAVRTRAHALADGIGLAR